MLPTSQGHQNTRIKTQMPIKTPINTTKNGVIAATKTPETVIKSLTLNLMPSSKVKAF